jgi:hypothetical protein
MIKSNGGIIGPDNVTTGGPFGTASGVFKLGEVTDLIKDSKWPTAGPASYQVANSLRLNGGDNCRLSRTSPNTAPTNADKFTISFWIKRSSIDAGSGYENQQIFTTYNNTDTTNFQEFQIYLTQNTLKIQTYYSSNQMSLVTSRLFRDTAAWYSIIFVYDSSQGTASNRQKLYINGVQETSFSTETYSGQDVDGQFAIQNHPQIIGTRLNDDRDPDFYLAEFVGVDGQALAHTDFGEFDSDSGIWKPKDVSGINVGNLGFYLNFQNSGALGTDVSGVGNFTLANLTSIDQSIDTCTNNFATLNPIASITDVPTFSDGNLTIDIANAGSFGAQSTIGVSSGKWYAEFKLVASSDNDMAVGVNSDGDSPRSDLGPGFGTHSTAYRETGTLAVNGSDDVSYGNSYAVNDIVGIALDLDNNKLYFSKNGTFQNSGDPTSGSTGTGALSLTAASSTESGAYFFNPGCHSASQNGDWSANFGSPPYSITSGNTDGNGFGNFEYAPPSGYLALCTNNLNA